jgi:hypothetical protein
MRDLHDPRLLYAKGILFLLTGTLAAGLLLAESFSWRVAVLLTISVWCFARAYYFAFYVIEHYIDSTYKFAGLTDFLRYLLRWRKNKGTADEQESGDKSDHHMTS